MTKTVYIGMTVDILHHGHIKIIERAREYGEILIGLLTDSAIAERKRLPALSYEQRKVILENIRGVVRVVEQEEWDYTPNLQRYKPDYMAHGDDWLDGPLAPYRQRAIDALSSYGGELLEFPYTSDVSSSDLLMDERARGIVPEARKASLRRLLMAKPLSRFIEVHSPLSALIAESVAYQEAERSQFFDGFWSSSLTDSTQMGKPDNESLEIGARLAAVGNIFGVTVKPLIMDFDTGGKVEHFESNVRAAERLGISAVIIEDKTGLKKNSLLGTDVFQVQDEPEAFAEKIRAGRSQRLSDNFMIIARIESLILDKGIGDALNRAKIYVEAGADGVMIHSRKVSPSEIFEFAELFRFDFPDVPLVCVPTSYNTVNENELAAAGFNVVIYANHLLRAAYPAMVRTARSILRYGRSAEIDEELISIPDLLSLIPGTN